MKIKISLLYTLLAFGLLTSCSDDAADFPETPADDSDVVLSIGYTTDGYGQGLSRTAAEETLCWSDWNEKKISSLDFYLIGSDGRISFHKELFNESNDCNVTHTLLEFKDNGLSNVEGLTFEMLDASSRVALVANYPLALTSDQRLGLTFESLYNSAVTFTEDQHLQRQEKFVMAGIFNLPAQISKYSNIVIPLRRIIAKIRLSIRKKVAADESRAYLAPDEFNSILCRYCNTARIIPDALLPNFSQDDKREAFFENIYPAAVARPAGPYSDSEWSYPEDLPTPHPADMIRENGHVYYTCPFDWVDYSRLTNKCNFTSNGGAHASHATESRYSIVDADDSAPILADREMFMLIKAPYNGHQFFYRVPINYRVSTINDQQCFSAADLTGKVLNLYRAQRNHFYDIEVYLDREGASTPQEATDPYFNLKVAPLVDGGTFDYIYDN